MRFYSLCFNSALLMVKFIILTLRRRNEYFVGFLNSNRQIHPSPQHPRFDHCQWLKRSRSGLWLWQYLGIQELKRKNRKRSQNLKICKLNLNNYGRKRLKLYQILMSLAQCQKILKISSTSFVSMK